MLNRLGNPTSLRSTVDYQDGTVVSRVLFRNDSGTLTAFAFSEGEGLSEHSNPNDAIVYLMEGGARFAIGETEFELGEGDLLHLPAGEPHTVHGGPPFKMLLAILKRLAPTEGEG